MKLSRIWRPGCGLLVIVSIGCGGGDKEGEDVSTSLSAEAYRETGDLEAIKKHGKFRILIHGEADGYLPRSGWPAARERRLAEDFARGQGLEPVIVPRKDFSDLIPALTAGQGDVIAANLSILDSRRQTIDFSSPIDQSREMVVTRRKEPPLETLSQLAGRTIAVQPETSYLETAGYIRSKFPTVKIKLLPGTLSDDQILDRVARGEIDLTIMDGNALEAALSYRSDIQPGPPVTRSCPLAFGIRKNSPALKSALNRFLKEQPRYLPIGSIHKDDLAGIRKRGTLRVLTVNNGATYFLWRGELKGFEYELARKFADEIGCNLEMVVIPAYGGLIPALREGKGDIIAALMTATAARKKRVAFSRPYSYAVETVVAWADESGIEKAIDLSGRTVTVREASSYRQTLDELKKTVPGLIINFAPAEMQTEKIIDRVAAGEYDLTVADSDILAIELTWRDDVKGVLALGEKVPHCWAVRESNTKLLQAINGFFDREYRGLFYNLAYKKYFQNPKKIKSYVKDRADLGSDGSISPYDGLVRKSAVDYDFDWRLITAQMYRESRFKPDAVSWAGAKGLLQVMPKTAGEMGLSPLEDPKIGIEAGVRYLDWSRDRFDKDLPQDEKVFFALSAYNAGAGHVFDARRLAKKLGLNPDRWFGNVEEAIMLLSRPEYAQKARYGYVRGKEVTDYVRSIRDRYRAYVELTGDKNRKEVTKIRRELK